MIQCHDCEFFHKNDDGEIAFSCDPFSTIKEPECLQKWQLLKINQLVASYQATLGYYRKLAPMQEKMFKVMEKEIDELNEGEKWKADADEPDEDQPPEDSPDRDSKPW